MKTASTHITHPQTRTSGMDKNPLEPELPGTLVLLGCLLIAYTLGSDAGESLTGTLRNQAIAVGLGLAVSVALDYRRGLRNLIRTDIVCLSALYFLTYVEFLFPQPQFNEMAATYDVLGASQLVILGMGCLALTRHMGFRSKFRELPHLSGVAGLSPNQWMGLFWIASGLGYFYMLITVNFNIFEMVDAMMRARFSQPWGRGKYGDWKALLYELSLFIYLIPPVYGILLAQRNKLPVFGFWLATLIAGFTLFYGFSSGTRNVFATYVAGMIGAYLLVLPKLKIRHVVVATLLGGGLLYFATNQMLAFRQVGLASYLESGSPNEGENNEDAFFIDANLLNMALVMESVPSRIAYLGWEVPYNAIVRPIPRAIWPGKPEGLSVGIEEAAGLQGLTLSITFVGEAYMAAGAWGVALAGAFFGALCGIWNSLFRGRWDPFSQLVYAAGFFPAAISMRSLFAFSTAILPIFGLLAIAAILRRTQAQRPITNNRKAPVPGPHSFANNHLSAKDPKSKG